jgi:hypothetical protein
VTKPLPLAGVIVALLLSACAQAAAPVASTVKASGRASVGATGAGTWFAPEPANPHDLLALADTNAWSKAAAATAVFQLSGSSIAALSDSDLATLATGLKRAGVSVALLFPALATDSGCGQPAGSLKPAAAPDLLRRFQAAGGNARFVAMESPAFIGTYCNLAPTDVATRVSAWSASVRAVMPQVSIGDSEPLTSAADAGAYAAWIPSYAAASGSPLAFIHLDLDWSLNDWPSQLGPLATLAHQSGSGLGIVARGNIDDASDALWVANAADRMAAVGASGVRVDTAILQSSASRPSRLLPETDAGTMTALVARSAASRTVLTLDRPVATPDGGETAGGRLVDQKGAPIAGATVDLAVRSLNSPGDFAQLTASGTVPAGAERALVGIRVATEGADPGPAELAVYRVSYQERPLSKESVPNPDFSAGQAGWGSANWDLARIESSDRGAGRMLHVSDNPAQPLKINSDLFSVTPGAAFTFTIAARMAPTSRGYFAVMFVSGSEISRTLIRFSPSVRHISAVTDAKGRLQWQVPAATLPAELDAHYAGDADRWPAAAIS